MTYSTPELLLVGAAQRLVLGGAVEFLAIDNSVPDTDPLYLNHTDQNAW